MQKVYDDFKNIFSDKGVLDIMLPQLQYYLLSLLIINTEGPDSKDVTNLYPFDGVEPGRSLVIYGGGTFGQHLYKKINNYKTHNVVAWIDEKHEHYSKLNLPVNGFDQMKSLEYDAVLIALIDEDNSNQALSKLVKHGVNEKKIIQVSHYNKKENIQEELLKFKINL
jgi:hypothetical protein